MLAKIMERLQDKSLQKKLLIAFVVLIPVGFFFKGKIDDWRGGAVGDGSKKVEFTVKRGEGSISVGKRLEKEKLIRSASYFQWLLKIGGNTRKIKQGMYILHNGMHTRDVIQTILSGKVKMRSFTIPEGYNNRQIGDLLTKKGFVESRETFLEITRQESLREKYKIPGKDVEGYLFPDTYSVPYHYRAEDIVKLMLRSFFKNLKKIPQVEGMSAKEIHKKVILASIVEREAKRDVERPKMAGVFENRIKRGIKLESCATVQYLFDKPKKRLFEIHLKKESPYNTYLHYGYPPGAISNPGFAALQAAWNPISTENLFFVLKPDGSHYFSQTLAEHVRAKRKYLGGQ
ncbi:MAG: endolytic transglycosylase MltG [Spirochaetota bacterium]